MSLCSMSSSLRKQKSWSPDSTREEAWLRRGLRLSGRRDSSGRSLSFTDDDLDELRACIELGFGFDSPEVEIDDRLTTTLPALGFYRAVLGQNYDGIIGRRSVDSGDSSSCAPSECGSPSPAGSPGPAAIFLLGEDPKEVKTRLRQWAQVVACSVQCGSGVVDLGVGRKSLWAYLGRKFDLQCVFLYNLQKIKVCC